MEKIVNEQFQEIYYKKVLDNGLTVVIFHKPDFITSNFAFATPYGAFDFKQVDEQGNVFEVPSGSAHFLEHKMFESEKGDVMAQFAEMGSFVNAFTSYTETVYYFSTTEREVEKPLNLLLDFVQDLSITEESVEKEKGIILEEVLMYEQMADSKLLHATFKNLYLNHPLRYDIGGDKESIYAVTKKSLEDCHRLNYHPSNMYLVAATPIDPEKIMTIIEENQRKKIFVPFKPLHRFPYQEPGECVAAEEFIEFDTNATKVSVAFKINFDCADQLIRQEKEWATRFWLEGNFSALSPKYQTWLDQKLINEYFSFDITYGDDYAFLMFYGESEQPEIFRQFLLTELQNLSSCLLEEKILEQLKHRYFGQAIQVFDSIDGIAVAYIRNEFLGVNFFESIQLLQNLTMKSLEDSYHLLDLTNHTMTIIGKKK